MDSVQHEHDDMNDLHHVVELVLNRLASRKCSRRIAQEVFRAGRGSRLFETVFAGELDINKGTVCKTGTTEAVFDCPTSGLDAFSCEKIPGGFNCTSTYNNPPCSPSPKDCSDFGCSTNDVQGKAYECQAFTCSSNYDCKLDLDFNCGGQFTCTSTNNCDSGHIFSCFTAFNCVASHTCSAGSQGITDCTKYPYDFGGDTNPNDFYCGDPNSGSDSFNCQNVFSCKSSDDFVCAGTTEFNCGSGTTGEQFECKSQFRCVSVFKCDRYGSVNCDVGTKYNCNKAGGYGCGQDRTGDVNCLPSNGSFNCTPESGKYGCTPGFGYSCTPSIGNYNCKPATGSGGYNCTPSGGGASYNCTPNFGGYTCTPSSGGYKCTPKSGGYNCTPGSGGYNCTPNNGGFNCAVNDYGCKSGSYNCTPASGGYQCPTGYSSE